MKTNKCSDCSYFESFAEKGAQEFYNKCALLDFWNMPDTPVSCEYFQNWKDEIDGIDPLKEEGIII